METNYLTTPGGRIAWDCVGDGPLVLGIPGMVDLRSTYRHLSPLLVNAGYRVATMDLRGHGDSDTTFDRYDDEAGAEDVIALLDHLGSPAILLGNSMGAGIAVIVAARRPDLVSGLVLLSPFVRNGSVNPLALAALRVATLPAFLAATWNAYLPSLYAGTRPADFDEYRRSVIAGITAPGHRRAISRTTRTSHAPAEAALGDVTAPVLVVMGERDPDFPDPRAEAEWIAQRTSGRVVMLAESGHYPQAQEPHAVASAITQWAAARA